MGTSLINLERVDFERVRVRDIWLFARSAPKLTQIRVWRHFETDNGEVPNTDFFLALNEERLKLTGARKLSIYMDENVYLQMKWAAKLHYEMIELRRFASCELEQFLDW